VTEISNSNSVMDSLLNSSANFGRIANQADNIAAIVNNNTFLVRIRDNATVRNQLFDSITAMTAVANNINAVTTILDTSDSRTALIESAGFKAIIENQAAWDLIFAESSMMNAICTSTNAMKTVGNAIYTQPANARIALRAIANSTTYRTLLMGSNKGLAGLTSANYSTSSCGLISSTQLNPGIITSSPCYMFEIMATDIMQDHLYMISGSTGKQQLYGSTNNNWSKTYEWMDFIKVWNHSGPCDSRARLYARYISY